MIVSADTVFGTLLALRREWHHPANQVAALLANLPQLEELLEEGGVVIFDRERIRVRTLPIGG